MMEKPVNVLAIGNSFSQDASKYLHQIASAGGIDLKIVNLYIGGCSLKTHYNNLVGNIPLYEYELNGKGTGEFISINSAIEQDDWDVVTLQQVSGEGGIFESYFPYITNLFDYIKKHLPRAKIMLHQTWAYEKGSDHTDFPSYDNNQDKMHKDIVNTYESVSKKLGDMDIIPCGEAFNNARKNKVFNTVMGDKNPFSLHRDGFHASFIYGRYLLGCVWYEAITGNKIEDNTFLPDGFDISVLPLIKDAAHKAIVN